VVLGDVPTDLLLAAKSHVDNLVREFTFAVSGAQSGLTDAVPPHLSALIDAVVSRFAEARQAIKRQALAAATLGLSHVSLTLSLPADAADAGEDAATTFARVRALADAAAGVPPRPHADMPSADRARPPRLTEAWFC
jgi:hypothetical protein